MAILKGLHRRLLLIIGIGGAMILFYVLKETVPLAETSKNGVDFLDKVMVANGGKENYDSLDRLSFTKKYKLFNDDGTVDVERKESHSYDFKAGINRLIQWKEDSITYTLVQRDSSLLQTANNVRDTEVTRQQLQNKLNAATFVIGLPYTLDTQESTKTYNGIVHFEGATAHELEVSFNNSSDVWKLYFSPHNLRWLGYWVKTSDHYSLVINEEMILVNGLLFSQKRKSYRTDAQKNRLYLRADYFYSDVCAD